jgi:agmatinase
MRERNFMDIAEPYSDFEPARFLILPVPYEKTTTYRRGTKFGPQAIILASSQVELFDEELSVETYRDGIHTLPPFTREEEPEVFLPYLAEHISGLIPSGKLIFMLGGEHTITIAAVAALTQRYQGISILFIDAHADLRDEYAGSRYNHACTARRLSNLAPLVQVGVRSISEEERYMLNKERVITILAHTLKDTKRTVQKILDKLSENVYITIDLDGLDPSVVPGVGTPVPGGMGWYDMLDILRAIVYKRNIIGVDVVELCPLGENVISEFTAAKLIYRIMGYIKVKQ